MIGIGTPLNLSVFVIASIYVQRATNGTETLAMKAIGAFGISTILLLVLLGNLAKYSVIRVGDMALFMCAWFLFFSMIILPLTIIYTNENLKNFAKKVLTVIQESAIHPILPPSSP